MAFRFSSLPRGIRNSLFTPCPNLLLTTRNSSNWARNSFFRSPISAAILTRKALWLIPLAGGVALWLTPQPQSLLPGVLQAKTLIPCNSDDSLIKPQPVIYSPSEWDQSLLSHISSTFRNSVWEPIVTAGRFLYLFYLFAPVILAVPMLLIGYPAEELHGDTWAAVWWYDLLVVRMERAGPTFIKLSQWAASRADLFSHLLCQRLGKLHSKANPHPFEHTKRVLERVFGKPLDEIFEDFDENPIGAGAIAQVYRATLKQDVLPPSYLDPKRQQKSRAANLAPTILQQPSFSVPTAAVAIKVLHPSVKKLISRDLSIMSFIAKAISLLPGMQWISLPEEVEVFGRMMSEQLDLRNEAENLDHFERNFVNRRVPVTFPRPLKTWSTSDVLVEEYQTALPLELFLRNGGGPFDDQIAEIGLNAFLNMLLLDNFVHSDLHPGNILVKFAKQPSTADVLKNLWNAWWHKDIWPQQSLDEEGRWDDIVHRLQALKSSPSAWRKELTHLKSDGYIPEIVFIDAGLITTLDTTDRKNFLDLFRSVAEFDGYRSGKLMVERCRSPSLAVDVETFALKMQNIVLNVKRKTFSLGQIKISDILTDVLRAVRQHHVKMEADFINTVISILLLEGIGRQLDPELDLFKSALPILRQLGRQMTAQQSLDAMKEIPSGNFGAFVKLWVWMEARELVSSSIVNVDDLVRYDWLVPSV